MITVATHKNPVRKTSQYGQKLLLELHNMARCMAGASGAVARAPARPPPKQVENRRRQPGCVPPGQRTSPNWFVSPRRALRQTLPTPALSGDLADTARPTTLALNCQGVGPWPAAAFPPHQRQPPPADCFVPFFPVKQSHLALLTYLSRA